jgi:hypothetical protein
LYADNSVTDSTATSNDSGNSGSAARTWSLEEFLNADPLFGEDVVGTPLPLHLVLCHDGRQNDCDGAGDGDDDCDKDTDGKVVGGGCADGKVVGGVRADGKVVGGGRAKPSEGSSQQFKFVECERAVLLALSSLLQSKLATLQGQSAKVKPKLSSASSTSSPSSSRKASGSHVDQYKSGQRAILEQTLDSVTRLRERVDANANAKGLCE